MNIRLALFIPILRLLRREFSPDELRLAHGEIISFLKFAVTPDEMRNMVRHYLSRSGNNREFNQRKVA